MDSMLIRTTPKGTIYSLGVDDLALQALISDTSDNTERVDDP